jgi:hypothetical protein
MSTVQGPEPNLDVPTPQRSKLHLGKCTLKNSALQEPELLMAMYTPKGVGPGPTLAWPGWKQPDIPVEVDMDRLETSRSEAGVLKKLSLAGIA